MKCNGIVVASVVLAMALGCPDCSAAVDKPVRGRNAASAVRSSKAGKSGKTAAQSSRRASNRGTERDVVRRMKEIRLPEISFKPPATIADAVDFFRVAAKDYDSADIPIEERGLNFALNVSADGAGIPVVPPVFASDIAFDEALKLVCESVGYMFTVKGGVVVVSSAASGEMELRNYSIKSDFAKVLDFLCASEGGDKPLENAFSTLGGVSWPEGAFVARSKTSGQLKVRNTYGNIDRLERVLSAFNATARPLTPPSMRSPNAAAEKAVVKRMKEMRLPGISFKPPTTIVDAVEFFRAASKDYGRPDVPIGKRGINFALKTPAGDDGWPAIPAIRACDIGFYDALKLVCESVGYKFTVKGNIVFVGSADSDEIEFRTYSMRSNFVKSMTTFDSGRGANEGPRHLDWKEFFSNLGVKWPEGSRIFFVEPAGKLFIGNTSENIQILERALKEIKAI